MSGSHSSQTHHGAPQVNELPDQITITDPRHPLYSQTFPLLRSKSARPNSRLVLILPNGHTRTVARSATDIDQPPAEPPPLTLITASTLLPLARFVCAKVLALEEHSHDASDHLNCSRPCDHIQTTTRTDECAPHNNLGSVGREPETTAHQTPGHTDSPSPRIANDERRRPR
jgi:hypothetical protein